MWGSNAGDQSFGGGGFSMAGGAGGFSSPMEGTEKRRAANKSQSLMPVTVAQLNDARHDDDGSFFVNEREMNHVTFVGVIRSIVDTSTHIVYQVDDMTGPFMTVRRFIQDSDEQTLRSECREGIYVRVTGHLRAFQEQRCVVAFTVSPITDFNELTFHLLEVIHSHLRLQKMAASGGMSMNDTMGGMMVKSESAAMPQAAQHFSSHQQQVLNAIIACRDSQGANIHDLFRSMKMHNIGEDAVRNAVDFLSQEGHIYSTIDDDHYKSTEEY